MASGCTKKSLNRYCFLVQCSIPACFSGLEQVSSWQANIKEMLRSIHSFFATKVDWDDIDEFVVVYDK